MRGAAEDLGRYHYPPYRSLEWNAGAPRRAGAWRHAGRRQAGEVPDGSQGGRMIRCICFAAALLTATCAAAQTYPAKTVTLLCWSAPGSPVDLYARIMAKLLTTELGQNVLVD